MRYYWHGGFLFLILYPNFHRPLSHIPLYTQSHTHLWQPPSFHTHLCPLPSLQHLFVHHHLSHILSTTHLSHIFTHIFVNHLSHDHPSHTSFVNHLCRLLSHKHLCPLPSLQHILCPPPSVTHGRSGTWEHPASFHGRGTWRRLHFIDLFLRVEKSALKMF